MQKAVYICDQCNKELGDNKHISLRLDQYSHSGIAIPPKQDKNQATTWKVAPAKPNFVHFCSGKCAGKYFDKLIKEAK